MSKINIMALGGLNENGKNIYTISIDGKILIFDAGIKFAPDKMYGVDYVIPNFKYLKDNRKKIFYINSKYLGSVNISEPKEIEETLSTTKGR
jgi:mRNA degradation ribonuclease J1/J2